jgi:serine/threonine protein phosphatase 1
MIYAVGDIHGCLNQLKRLVTRCLQDSKGQPAKFVFVGDYIDRGPDSRGVVEFVMDLQARSQAQVICLSGNHEELALAAVTGGRNEEQGLHNGGDDTLSSYGVTRAADLPPAHLLWFDSLATHHDDGRRFFVHAGVHPDRPLEHQDPYDLLWIREPFLSDERDYGRLIVHGHTPLSSGVPDQRRNRLNIDTAAVLGGPLTAAVFDDERTEPIRFLEA